VHDPTTTLPDELEQLIAQLPTLAGDPGPYIGDQAQDDLDELGAGNGHRKPKDAVLLGRTWVLTAFWCGVGYCLRTIRSLYGVAALHPDATTAWENTRQRHHQTDPDKIPWGVPVWWVNDGFGHVALSLGRGRCLTTDYVRTGHLGIAPIAALGPWCRGRLVGWSEDINGVDVWDPPEKPWDHGDRLRYLEAALQRAIDNGAPKRRIRGLRRWLREEKTKP
jgi:hypothetical protein